MVNKIILILLLFSSCKKKDCDVLHQRVKNSFNEYKTASQNNNANPSTQDSLIAVEKYNEYNNVRILDLTGAQFEKLKTLGYNWGTEIL